MNRNASSLRTPARSGNDEEAALSASNVVLVVFDGAEAIDVAAPASVFSKAEELRPGTYRLQIASPRGGTVITNSGLSLAGTRKLDELPAAIDTLVVAGGDEDPLRAAIVYQDIGSWLAETPPPGRPVGSLFTRPVPLSAAG